MLSIEESEPIEDDVHLWHYNLDITPERRSALARLLDDKEHARAARFKFDRHRGRFVTGRGILREILARYVDANPETLHFDHGKYGKPRLVQPYSANAIAFSVSNSHNLGAVAIAKCCRLGLVIEQVRQNLDYQSIAAQVFTPEEQHWFNSLPVSGRLAAFFDLWVCKEAYLKGEGLGLSAPLNHISISLTSERRPRLISSIIPNTDPAPWVLYRPVIRSGVTACLAINRRYRKICSSRWLPGET